jgi:hypothetical protein
MLKRLTVLMLASLALLSMTALVNAQESISYGDVIEGEITDREYEIEYTFEAAEGDLVVVEMRRADTDSELYNADVIVLNPDGDIVADTTDYYGSNGAQAVVLFEAEDGEYTILATRDGGRGGDEEGNFTLRLLLVDELTAKPVEGEMGTDALDAYYAIRAEGNVDVTYTWLSGNYAPLMQVRPVEELGYPSDQTASVSGTLLNTATINLVGEDGQLLLVSVIGDPIDYLFDDVEATFEIGLAR